MCRLFGLHAGSTEVAATFWLISAPDSLEQQSRRNPDGAGIGVFSGGRPSLTRQPIAAWQDDDFAASARDLRGTTFLAHVRYASTGGRTPANTHPFLQDGRLFAHNGVVLGLDMLEVRLTELGVRELVLGQTDSERVFALVTAEIRLRAGDVEEGLLAALGWIADRLPVYALNILLVTATDLWALRYPATNEIYLLDRPAGGTTTDQALDARSPRITARSSELSEQRSVVVASEPMDADPGWRLLEPGELIHVSADLTVTRSLPLPSPPAVALTRSDLDARSAASQAPAVADRPDSPGSSAGRRMPSAGGQASGCGP